MQSVTIRNSPQKSTVTKPDISLYCLSYSWCAILMIDDCEVVCVITSDTLHKKAADMVRQCGTRDTVTVAKELGIHLYYRDNFSDLLGMYAVIQRRRCAFLNNRLDDHLLQIVLAHEIGHDTLHRSLAKQDGLKEFMLLDIKSRPEYEANVFAAHLLLDDDEVYTLIKDGYGVEQIAQMMNSHINLVLIKMNELHKLGYDFRIPDTAQSDFLKKIKQ